MSKSGHSPLVGRDREIGLLEKSWTLAQAGTLSTPGVVFRGEPGIGKSRLAAAAAELVEASGSVVLELVGSPFHTDAGLYPIRTLLEQRCGIARNTDQLERLRLLDAEVRACGLDPPSTVPLLAPVLGIEVQTAYEPVAAEGRKLYELIAQGAQAYLLASLAGRAGLVLVEDLHWFDPSTQEVLGALLDTAAGRLLVVMTARPGGWLPTGRLHRVIDVAPLTDEQTHALIGALSPAMTADQRAAVAARCDGVPFYIEQVVSGRSETGIPEALYEPLFARLRASPKVVPVVEAAAILGREIDRDLLCSVVDVGDDAVDAVIRELEDALVLEPWPAGIWRFRHELLREIAAELAPPSVRRGLHSRVADVLIGAGDPDWRLVAAHYEHAARFDDAASAYHRASIDARRRGALAEARDDLTLALAQLDQATQSADRDRREAALRRDRGFLSFAAEGYQSREAATDFERCLHLGETNLGDDELFTTLSAVWNYYLVRGDLRRAAKVVDVLRAGVEDRQRLRPAIEVLFGAVAWLRGEFDAAHRDLQGAMADLAAADQHRVDTDGLLFSESSASVQLYLAFVALPRGDLASAEGGLALAARLAEGLGFPATPYMHAYLRSMTTWLRIETGQLDRAAVLAADLIEQAERYGFDMWPLVGVTWQAAVDALAVLDDRVDPTALGAHIATITTRLDALRTLGVYIYTTVYDAVLGRLLIAAGQLAMARERLDTGLQLAQDTGMHFYDAELLRLRAHTHAAPKSIRADLDAALELARRQGAHLFELRSALDDFELRGDPARDALVTAVSRMPTDSAMPELARARAAVELTNPEQRTD